ncbi:hypothetical protein [Oceanirhabdus seepicola]|uniref:Lipoprotein n=1 Tax=Oceanirhabdus seepicola TaxID=2828781 RepID=A0A9J6P6F9_9CLOT|nr:hypothetical protein [Oceanirhabdus seepicola]MCM1991836.1 hypothetical protein [Oceanirhabdus seepicola]
MNRKKIIVLATALIISTLAFVGCGKTNNDNTLNKEKAKVEDTTKKDTDKKDIQKENNKEDNKENVKIEDGEVEKVEESEKVGETDTELGKEDSSESEEVKLKEYDAVATIDPLMFGANVTVTCEDSEIATYKIFTEIDGKMEPLHNDKIAIGEVAKELFPAKEGQTVVVKFFDANGTLLGESETTLVI